MGREKNRSSSSSRSRSRSSSSSRSRSRSRSPRKERRRSHSRSRSPPRGKRLSSIAASRDVSPPRRNRREEGPKKRKFAYDKRSESSEDESKYEYGKKQDSENVEVDAENDKDKEKKKPKPNFALSGKLSEEQRTTERGAVLNFVEPPEARKPRFKWRLYPFKGEEALEPILLHKQSAYLVGRDRTVVHIPVDHPSCSKQHAVIQWRLIEREDPETGDKIKEIKPYIMDLESTNGTFLCDDKIKSRRYYELKEKDVIKFGFSTREYVVIKDDEPVEEED